MGLIRENKVEALAVGSSSRSSLMPNLPTTVEAGYPDSDYNFWIGVFVPAATPQPIVARLHDETRKALQTAEIKDRLAKFGAEPMDMTLAQFEAYFNKELELNADAGEGRQYLTAMISARFVRRGQKSSTRRLKVSACSRFT